MNLPFVRPARFRQLEHNAAEMRKANHVLHRANDRLRGERDEARSQTANWKALFDAERLRTEGLTQRLLDMKRDGFTTATQRQALPAAAPSRVELAIIERSGNDRRLLRYLTSVVAGMERARKTEDEIYEAVTKWRDPDEEVDATT